jgi:hypothetical protein
MRAGRPCKTSQARAAAGEPRIPLLWPQEAARRTSQRDSIHGRLVAFHGGRALFPEYQKGQALENVNVDQYAVLRFVKNGQFLPS